MALNFTGLASIIPGFMDGYEKAIRSNYQDMKDYNQIDQGQLSNLYDKATFSNMVDQNNYQTNIAELQQERARGDMGLYWLGYGGQAAQQQAYSMAAPYLLPYMYAGQARQFSYLNQQPMAGFRMPSVVGV